MNLLEAKRELIEHGYEIRQLNECYGFNSRIGGCYGGADWSDHSYKPTRTPYRKDSELSAEELKKRNELRAKKARNKEIKEKLEPLFEKYAKKLERNYDVYTRIEANKGSIIVELGNNLQIKMTKTLDNNTYFDLGTANGWDVSSDEILEFIDRGAEIKKLMANFRKFNINI